MADNADSIELGVRGPAWLRIDQLSGTDTVSRYQYLAAGKTLDGKGETALLVEAVGLDDVQFPIDRAEAEDAQAQHPDILGRRLDLTRKGRRHQGNNRRGQQPPSFEHPILPISWAIAPSPQLSLLPRG